MASLDELDRKIQEALRRQDDLDESLAQPADEGLIDMLIGVFRGRMLWWHVYAMVLTLVFSGLAIWFAVRFFQTTDFKTSLAWGLGSVVCFIAVAMIKIYFWMEMHKNAVLREVKRLELQVARMASKMKS